MRENVIEYLNSLKSEVHSNEEIELIHDTIQLIKKYEVKHEYVVYIKYLEGDVEVPVNVVAKNEKEAMILAAGDEPNDIFKNLKDLSLEDIREDYLKCDVKIYNPVIVG